MTREEIDFIGSMNMCDEISNEAYKKIMCHCEEQEPCEDDISRQAVLDQTYLWSKDEFLRVTNPFDYLRKRINSLPSVKPQEPKMGHWIWCVGSYKCSNCEKYACFNDKELARYCPNCGARMVESEDKE